MNEEFGRIRRVCDVGNDTHIDNTVGLVDICFATSYDSCYSTGPYERYPILAFTSSLRPEPFNGEQIMASWEIKAPFGWLNEYSIYFYVFREANIGPLRTSSYPPLILE
jgi:hypothetical protein